MVFLVGFVLCVLSVCALMVWKRVGDEPAAVRPWRAEPSAESSEGLLAAQLAAGDITDREYVRAMERIAARDG
ncbi:hypothetical protein [Paractinoplanes globisporus]|uniref:SHOCT domain-containing protein n=1 Tax=Paractinoplanes globisporus TaxID=113565 RepID=A0ABW6WBA8_9ACTN|nr:hypothetical protein [Actinoplanes globisporus]